MKKKFNSEWATFQQAKATVLEEKIKFAGRTYEPDPGMGFVVCEMCHSLPAANSKDRCFTAATMANSARSAEFKLQNFNHRMKFYGSDKDEICGAIVAVEFPDKKDAVERSEKGESVALKALVAVWKNAEGVTDMLLDMATGRADWKVSMECGYYLEECALWDGEKFYPWSDCTDEMKALVKANKVEDWEGKKMKLAMGGVDGEVLYNGNAFTQFPADKEADITQFAASDRPMERRVMRLNSGWRKPEDFIQAVASFDKPVQEKAGLVVGVTGPGGTDGHTHEVIANLGVLPTNGHSHYLESILYDAATGTLEAVARGGYWDEEYRNYIEHSHKVVLGPGAVQETASIIEPPNHTEGFKMEAHIKYLRETAATLKKDKPELAASMEKEAAEIEKKTKGDDVQKQIEETMDARIKNGDLVTKSAHAEAVEKAKKEGREALEKEQHDKAEAEKKQAETREKRMKALADAKLDPEFKLRKDATLKQVVEEISCDEAGDKEFEKRLEEWSELNKKSGAMTLSTASADDDEGTKIPPHAGGKGGNKEADVTPDVLV